MDIDDILADVSGSAGPSAAQDLRDLTRLWVSERVAPELLPYPQTLMERVLGRIRKQIELVEEQTGNMEPKTNFRLIIVQTELERFRFLVRSFLRARIAKLDAHQLHYIQNPEHLSSSEQQYLNAHHALISQHYQASFLSQFPAQLQRLDDKAGGISMVDAPDADTAVFCRVLRDSGTVTVEGAETEAELNRGDVYVIRWSVIRDKVLAGDIELI